MDCQTRTVEKSGWLSRMSSLEIDFDELRSNRLRVVQQLLVPLRQAGIAVGCHICRYQHAGCKVIVAHEGTEGVEYFSEFYFQTFAPDIWSQYYELWRPFDGYSRLRLYRAYLNIVMANRETHAFNKLVSVHCDPCEEGDEPQRSYKRGPHLHVERAQDPIPKCHFPLNLTELNRVLSSVGNITDALKSAVQIISDEVVSRYQIAAT